MAAGTEIPRPHIVTDPSLLDTTVPFKLEFDEERATMLLHDNGMSPAKIEELSIILTRRGKTGFQHGGTYFGPTTKNPEKIIMLSGEEPWERYERRLRKNKDNPEEVLAETNRNLNRSFLSLAHLAIEDSKYALWRRPMHEEALVLAGVGIPSVLGYQEIVGPLLASQDFLNMLPARSDSDRILIMGGLYFAGMIGSILLSSSIASKVLERFNIVLGETNRANKRFVERTDINPNFNSIIQLVPAGV